MLANQMIHGILRITALADLGADLRQLLRAKPRRATAGAGAGWLSLGSPAGRLVLGTAEIFHHD